MDPKKQYAFKEYLQKTLPAFCMSCGCLKQNKRDRNFERARFKLHEELDIVHLL
jgi:hypothetical protein